MESVMKRTTATGFLSTCAISLALFSSCTSVEPNTLTPEEIADGWQLLFDGKTLNGWKDYNGTTLTQPWHVVDGCIQAKGDGSDASGYIVTDKQYENFELSWDWKLSKGGNSGMLYHVVERPQFAVPYVTGRMAEVGCRLRHAPPRQGKNESKPARRVEQFKDRIRQRTCRTLVERSQNPRIRSLD